MPDPSGGSSGTEALANAATRTLPVPLRRLIQAWLAGLADRMAF